MERIKQILNLNFITWDSSDSSPSSLLLCFLKGTTVSTKQIRRCDMKRLLERTGHSVFISFLKESSLPPHIHLIMGDPMCFTGCPICWTMG